MNKTLTIIGCITAVLAMGAYAAVSGPYTIDADTLHLYHFDGNADDAVTTDPLDLTLAHGAAVTDSSYAGFGAALNTWEGSSDTASDQPIAYADEISISRFTGADGGFTFEAIVRPDTAISAIPNHMQIISGEDDGTYRGWQFRINTAGQMEFIKLTGTQENFAADLPAAGDHAWQAGQWFHAAVTYNGQENTAGNLTFYWTRLDSDAEEAAVLASFTMTEDLWAFLQIDFAVGNEGRNASGENFEGLLDEVRISSVARAADEMLIVPGIGGPIILTHPAPVTVQQTETAVFETTFESPTAPTAAWFKTGPAGDIELSPADPDIALQITPLGGDQYTAALQMAHTAAADCGEYYCRLGNESGLHKNTDPAALLVLGLTARWTFDQAHYSGGLLLDSVGDHHALPAAEPLFVEAAGGIANGAVRITDETGWAQTEAFDPAAGSGSMTLSVWANWQQTSPARQNLETAAYPEADSLTAPEALTADTQWQHLCITYSPEAVIYIDGLRAAEGPWTLPENTRAILTLGAAGGPQQPFTGDLDDLRIYNYALTNTEVAEIYYEMTGRGVCLPEFTGPCDRTGPEGQPDCVVDLYDLADLADQWLTASNFEEFAECSGGWKTEYFTPN